MKKLYLIIIALTAGFLSLTSCHTEFLDPHSISAMDESSIYSNYDLATGSVMSIYNDIVTSNASKFISYGNNTDAEVNLTSKGGMDDGSKENHRTYAVYNYRSSDNQFAKGYTSLINSIEKANVAIAGLTKYGDLNTNEGLRYLYGEVLFLRSYIFAELINLFGDIPARFEPVTAETIYIPRTDRDVIYKQILKDLKEAQDYLPYPGEGFATNILRANKAIAKGLRAKVALTAGGYSYRLYEPFPGRVLSRDPELAREKMYEIALQECKELMEHEGSGYILEPDFEKIFKQNCAPVTSTGQEVLWALPFKRNQNGNWMVSVGVYHRGDNAASTIPKGSDPYATVPIGGTMGLPATLWYDYDAKDIRRDVSVAPWRWGSGKQELHNVCYACSGKLRAEWCNEQLIAKSNDGTPPIVMRYADVLLMYAEAENELNGPTPEAKNALLRIRNRAFKEDQTSYVNSVATSKDAFFNAIVTERKFEFCGERGIRFRDLKRWNLLKTKLDESKASMLKLRELKPPYDDVPAYVFWRVKDGEDRRTGVHTEYYGLERGEYAPGTEGKTITDKAALKAWMDENGWRNWHPAGRYAGKEDLEPGVDAIRMWISGTPEEQKAYDEEFANQDDFKKVVHTSWINDEYITAQYKYNPDEKQELPLPLSIVTDSQGMLNNDNLGY